MMPGNRKMIELLDFVPKGKGRPRFTRSGHAYTPERTRDYESALRTVWILQCGTKPFEGPVTVSCEFCFPVPASWPKKRKANALNGGEMVKKPDCDNLIKAVLDALNGIAYTDDSQVQAVAASKRYADRAAIRVWVTEEGEDATD